VDRSAGRLNVLQGESHEISIVWVEDDDPKLEGRKRIEMAKVTLVLAPSANPGADSEVDPARGDGLKAGKGRGHADESLGNRK
jgi:hypothetical protein